MTENQVMPKWRREYLIREITVQIMKERSGTERMTLQQWHEWLDRLLNEMAVK